MNSSKVRSIVGWVLVVLLALAYLAAAAGKLTGAATQIFAHWGYPAWFATLIGVLELTGAIGLLIPKTMRYAVLGLTVIMIGAAYTHLANHERLQVLRPTIFLALLWAVGWLRQLPISAVRLLRPSEARDDLGSVKKNRGFWRTAPNPRCSGAAAVDLLTFIGRRRPTELIRSAAW